jgi:hypothetical protein
VAARPHSSLFLGGVRLHGETFTVLACCIGTAKGIIAMRITAGDYLHAALQGLRRSPVLTAIIVYLVVFAAAVLIAGFAVWRSTACCPATRGSKPLYLVQMSADVAGQLARPPDLAA